MKAVLISLFFSTAALANTPSLCRRLLDTFFPTTPPSRTAVLERQIKQKFLTFSELHIKTIEKATGVDEDDYFTGLSNLNLALKAGVVWDSVKFDSIYITKSSGIGVHLDTSGKLYVNIPHDMPAHSILPTLSTSLLEFGIERKLKKRKSLLRILNRDESLPEDEYREALEVFYKVLDKGPIPEELEKIHGITIYEWSIRGDLPRELDISYLEDSGISEQGVLRAHLAMPVRSVLDLEGMAIAVLELEVAQRLIKDYSYHDPSLRFGPVVVNDGVDRKMYKRVLKKLIERLTDNSITTSKNLQPDLKNLRRIHVVKYVNDEGGVNYYSGKSFTSDGDHFFDLFFPDEIVLRDAPMVIPSSLLERPAERPKDAVFL